MLPISRASVSPTGLAAIPMAHRARTSSTTVICPSDAYPPIAEFANKYFVANPRRGDGETNDRYGSPNKILRIVHDITLVIFPLRPATAELSSAEILEKLMAEIRVCE